MVDSSGKMGIVLELEYESTHIQEQEDREDLKMLGLQNDNSRNITFEEMKAVVNEIDNEQSVKILIPENYFTKMKRPIE